jgi:S-DNA-T family DNA segregation ATPase FtsK/SpoIIIE
MPEPRKKKSAPEVRELAPSRASTPEEEAQLPPRDLLSAPPAQDTAADAAELDRLGLSLLETLRTFKVDGTIAGRTSGPVVTQFEVVPAPGVKVGRIMALSDDLAVTMRAASVRVAPIPGKGAVGVEIPNPTARVVKLRELLDAAEWERSRAVLPVALGRDLEGKAVVADLSKMPHLLIAGATGAGKSVAINTIITGLVYRYTPRDLRFLMIDPKMVELSMYNALPHLRHKVVTNNHDAARALKWAVWEMNRRYELLHANNARNLADFNKKVADGKPLRTPEPPKLTLSHIAQEAPDTPPAVASTEYTEGHLPFIVVIVDELADLMMTVQGEVETPLAMLAQKARAIGIHLILATQRPSVNVITGLIKANFPSRIAFRVASKVDSRTILDQNGAEALLGNGDMLFLPPGKSEPMRLQGAFISTEETEKVMDWYEARRAERIAAAEAPAAPEEDILEVILAQESEEEGGGPADAAEGERDALFRQAAELCIQNQGGSTSLLQRRLSIGYGRASRILDQLEVAGILAPGNPNNKSRPRDVRIGIEQLDEYCS